jgi:long-chain acyl-CoA synthetase
MKCRNYLEMTELVQSERIAVVTETGAYTYGALAGLAKKYRDENLSRSTGHFLHIIRASRVIDQLIAFLGCSGTMAIPLLVPEDFEVSNDFLHARIPENACMAVMTSGTSGTNKLLFRTFESWHDFFPVQNEIFSMNRESRIFMQGSLAFTGNLNLCLAQLAVGGMIVACDTFDPRLWIRRMEENHVTVIYLIPAKLRVLKRICEKKYIENRTVTMIVSGSQSLGGSEVCGFKKIFPRAEMILYYGASELSYVTYVKSGDMCGDKTLIGKPFLGVNVRVEDGKILVTTDGSVIGMEGEAFIGDYGHMDGDGFFYFDGRQDDICNVNGRKVSAIRVENALLELPEVAEAAVKVVEKNGREYLAAFIVPAPGFSPDFSSIRSGLRPLLPQSDCPRIFQFTDCLPKTESGKILKRELV